MTACGRWAVLQIKLFKGTLIHFTLCSTRNNRNTVKTNGDNASVAVFFCLALVNLCIDGSSM